MVPLPPRPGQVQQDQQPQQNHQQQQPQSGFPMSGVMATPPNSSPSMVQFGQPMQNQMGFNPQVGYGNQGYSNQGFGNQDFGNQGYGDQSYGNQGQGHQGQGNQGQGNQGQGKQGQGNQGKGNRKRKQNNVNGGELKRMRSDVRNPVWDASNTAETDSAL